MATTARHGLTAAYSSALVRGSVVAMVMVVDMAMGAAAMAVTATLAMVVPMDAADTARATLAVVVTLAVLLLVATMAVLLPVAVSTAVEAADSMAVVVATLVADIGKSSTQYKCENGCSSEQPFCFWGTTCFVASRLEG
jgi:hypothetical protein